MTERQKNNLRKTKKSKKDILTDIIVLMIVICVVGGMLVYAHFDIKEIVNG
tara:strand:- start:146 stop:298 length:153 start_codon:yes stop_codon:yes gene_type:complete